MPPDFERDVRAVLGLVFDAVDEAGAADVASEAALRGRRCWISTPNLDFTAHCLTDADFRATVLQSDLSIADGWPIVWVSRLIGSPLPGRISGSNLFERLRVQAPLRVYFFGGPPGASEAACKALNAASTPMTCVGFASPGFGDLHEMSSSSWIDPINESGADFLVVSIGAKKGQSWIQRNLDRLSAPVVAYLGAVVNFSAGSIRRAPKWVQDINLEWLWRIKEEPALWRRYAHDAVTLVRLLVGRVAPLALWHRLMRPAAAELEAAESSVNHTGGETILTLRGAWVGENSGPLREQLAQVSREPGSVAFDLSHVTALDSTVIGLMLLLHGWQGHRGQGWRMVAASSHARRLLRWHCCEFLLDARLPHAEANAQPGPSRLGQAT